MKKQLPFLLMLLILLLAAALRIYNLGAQSFWYDEGVAWGHSQRSLWEMIPRLQNNVHVPAYFGSLALWEDFTGSSEFALRFYSVLWSIISVAAAYALGKRLAHPIVGLSAALLLAVNGFSIHYAQETRMYAMLAAVGALSFWAFVRFAQIAMQPYTGQTETKKLWQWAIAFAVFNTIGEYTHVSYALLMLSQGVMATLMLSNLAWRATQAKIPFMHVAKVFGIYLLVNLASVLLFSPWIGIAIAQTGAQPNISDVMSLPDVLQLIQGYFAFGMSYKEGIGGMATVAAALLVFSLLIIPNTRKPAWWILLLPIVWLLLSVSGYLALNLYARYLRFLLPAQIAFLLIIGRGVWVMWELVPRHPKPLTRNLPKITAVAAVLALAWTAFSILPALYHDPDYQRDDYRGLAGQIEAAAGEDDAVILSSAGLQEIFGYYYDGLAPVFPLPIGEDVAGDTEAVINSAEMIYVVFYGEREQDPERIVERTLNANAFPIDNQWIGDVRLLRYASPDELGNPIELNTLFGDSITLESYALNKTRFNPNDILQIQLQWTTNASIANRYKIFLQLLDSNGVLVAQRDSEAVNNDMPTNLWQVGETVQDNHAIALPNLPAGEYTLIIGLYDINDANARLSVGDGNYLELARIFVE